MKNEISVYLVLAEFDCDPNEVTAATGLQPEEVWRTGDQIGRAARYREDNGWKVSSGIEKSVGLNEQVNALLNRIEPAQAFIAEFAKTCYLEIACVVKAYEYAPEMHLERSTLQKIAQLGAETDIDFYCLIEEDGQR
jgi:hypothetical protein